MNKYQLNAEDLLEKSKHTNINKIIPNWVYLNTKGKVLITIINPKIAMIKMKVNNRYYFALKCLCHEKQKYKKETNNLGEIIYTKIDINQIFLCACETAYPQLIQFLKEKNLLNCKSIDIEIQQINNFYYTFKLINKKSEEKEEMINLIYNKELIDITKYDVHIINDIGHKIQYPKYLTTNELWTKY